ncbi:PaaI family thioesterase [Cytobacillus sp. FJAT-54145]|uniref:PaaI family thioesterase n=1 Tax=Cytobacillus spartinae TaxID=3299023 RepID=A0ABW6K5J1_9BACI
MTTNQDSTAFKSSSFWDYLGFKTLQFEKENVVIELDIQEHHLNAINTLHGGVHAAMIDNIIGATINSVTKLPSTTINLSINYFAPVETGIITARANLLQIGYRIVTGEGVITDSNGKIIAKGTGTFKILRPKNDSPNS